MRAIAILFVGFLVGCGTAPQEPEIEAPSFAENPYRYCMDRDAGWLAELLSRLNRSAPFRAGTAAYEHANVQKALIDGIIREDLKELQLRFTLEGPEGETHRLSAYGVINPDTCAVGPMQVFEGVRPLPETAPLFTTG